MMTTTVYFGNRSYDLDTPEGNKAFVNAMRAQSMMVPAGLMDTVFVSIAGAEGAVEEKKIKKKRKAV